MHFSASALLDYKYWTEGVVFAGPETLTPSRESHPTMSAVLTYDQTPSQGSIEGEKDLKYGGDVADNQQGIEPAVLEDGEANLKIDRE